jgi:LytS/YehU family sensor histidine kinase
MRISARIEGESLRLAVEDDGAGADPAALEGGTGLSRLRQRLEWLYGERARLELAGAPSAGFGATLVVPRRATSEGGAQDD